MTDPPEQQDTTRIRTDAERTGGGFQTTRWTLIDQVRTDQGPRRAAAMGALLSSYWPAVYTFLRRRGMREEAAAETTQAFFVNVVLSNELFESAQRERGRLRTLVLTALQNFLVDERRRAAAQARADGLDGLGADAQGRRHEEEMLRMGGLGKEAQGAEGTFERRWALAQVEEALRRCREHFQATGKDRHWRAFEARVLLPAVSMSAPPPLCHVATEVGFGSAADAAAAVQVVKKRLVMLLHGVVAETLECGEEVEAEVRGILDLLGP